MREARARERAGINMWSQAWKSIFMDEQAKYRHYTFNNYMLKTLGEGKGRPKRGKLGVGGGGWWGGGEQSD